MPVSLTPAEVADELRARGHIAEDVTPLSGGMWSAAFAFREKGRDYVIRFHDRRDDLEKDRFAERWRKGALRIPHMVEIGDFGEGGYGIAERIHGRLIDDLDEAGMRRVLPALFASLDALRSADLSGTSGYGVWHADGRAKYASWRNNLVLMDAPGERGLQRDALARTAIGCEAFDAGMDRIRELLPFAPEDRWVAHNDLLYRNVFVDDDGVVLIDWGASIFGDFLYDFALLTFWWPWYANLWGGIDIRAEIDRHFQHIGLTIPHYAERMRICELDIGVGAIAFQAGHDLPDHARWTARHTAALATAPIR